MDKLRDLWRLPDEGSEWGVGVGELGLGLMGGLCSVDL